jgi:hypothetical protein
MNRPCVKYTVIAVPLLLTLSCGLHHVSVRDPLPADQLTAVLQQSFQSADASTAETVRKIVEETQRHDVAAAFQDVKLLSAQPNLTQDQRITAIRAANTIGQQLQEAAQKGDQQASDAMHNYNGNH